MILGKLFSAKNIKLNLESTEKDELFEELVDLYVSNDSSISRDSIIDAIREREAKLSTGIKKGIALPHARISGLKEPRGIIGVSKKGIEYDSLDGNPVYVVFMLLSTVEDYSLHLKILNRLNILLLNPKFLEELFRETSREGIYNMICKYEDMLIGGL
ncbi:PTS sugar transporter subunit IIA [Treponema pedis]|uniref:PTS transporter subunit IIA-likenitrogen-regulatory protein PtsN n=2 Tax=Treponema pedis TaxID=409322 RepID=S6A418_9SPIR|nr:PTS sugar transporter subunit IIA [Treponema pedis]AGT44021.1 PTS transporter subunit IIA-likenitrogen-regulatory protein PtsN [Treponema pedis str. T A4]QOW61860.1 PTS sugar transporter subunit IIA [Treponema pedis]QSI04747.1 PTS sugar transporter subunit IIA [Treponema pedis]